MNSVYNYYFSYTPCLEKSAIYFITVEILGRFLHRGRIACNAEHCISHRNSVRLSVRPSVCHTLVLYPDE